jgi:sugar/nucleoside kinase (ribokinase family)
VNRARPRPEVVCVGAANLDTIAIFSGDVIPDGRIVADSIVSAGGGPAATAAVALARLGVPVGFCGVVGADSAGRRVVELLESEGVDCTWVRVEPTVATALSVILVNAETGDRSIITKPAPKPLASDIPLDVPWLHVDHSGWGPAHEALGQGDSRAKLSLDGGNPIDGLMLDRVHLYAPTVAALAARYPEQNMDSALALAASEGPELVVATDGSAGSWVYEGRNVRDVPAFPVEVVSTLGAGDVFHGALLAGLVLGRSPDDAVRFASAVAALSCRAIDGRSGIPDLEETERFLKLQMETL